MQEFSPLKETTKKIQEMRRKGQKRNNQEPLLAGNFGMLLVSFLLAVSLWFFITSYQDPEAVLTVNDVTVKLLHTDTLDAENKICTVLDETDVIPVVTVTASRSIVDSLRAENIIATADLDMITEDGMIPIVITTNKYSDSITSISGSSRYVYVSIEDRVTETFTLEASTRGAVAPGYLLSGISTDQNQVRVTGPESLVSSVSAAGVIVDVSGAGTSISTNAEIHLYDHDGNDVEIGRNLTMNIDKVMVNVEILPIKEVQINAKASGLPASGFRVSGEYMIEPGTVRIAGKRSVLESISEIVIPSSSLDVTGLNRNLTRTFLLSNYLPEGTRLVDEDASVRITVEIVLIPQEQFEAPAETEETTDTTKE